MGLWREKTIEIKGLLSIQFLIGMTFFITVLIFSTMFLVFYSLKYFDSLNVRDKYLQGVKFLDNFYDNILNENGIINSSFYKSLEKCEGVYFDSATKTFNKDYLNIINILNPDLIASANILHERYIVLFTYFQYNQTTKKGIYNNTEEVMILRPLSIDAKYNTLMFNGNFYRKGDLLTYNGEEYIVDYIDSKGNIAILKATHSLCGPSTPKFKRNYYFNIYVYNYGIIEKYNVFVW